MLSRVSHKIKHRKIPNDNFTTPAELAIKCIDMVPLKTGDTVLDAALGMGIFYNNYPNYVSKKFTTESDLFLLDNSIQSVDWIITNPPYSHLDMWFKQSCQLCRKGFAYLLGIHNITPKRIEMVNKMGFGLTQLYLCKVYEWFGISCFVVFQRGAANIVSYDRKVYYESHTP